MTSLRSWQIPTHSDGVIQGLKQANLVSYVSTQTFNKTLSILEKNFKHVKNY